VPSTPDDPSTRPERAPTLRPSPHGIAEDSTRRLKSRPLALARCFVRTYRHPYRTGSSQTRRCRLRGAGTR